jgi:DNA modification methylase
MNIKRIPIEKIELNTGQIEGLPANPRQWTRDDIDRIAASLKETPELFEMRPCIVYPHEGKYVLLAGNLRFCGARQNEMKDVPCCVVPRDTSIAKMKEIVLKDNGSWGAWDFDELANKWDDLPLTDWGVPAWEEEEEEEELEAVEDDFDIPDEIETDIVLGDFFEIGEHRLLCGDSTDSDSVAKLMNGEKAEILFTSPPYNAGSNKNIPNSGGLKYIDNDDNKTEDHYFSFLCSNINAFLPFVNEIFYNIGLIERSKRSIIKLLYQYKDIFKDIIYWKKSTVAPHIQPGIINNKIEFILCFGNGSRKFQNAQFPQGTYWNVIEGPNASGNEYAKIHKATFPLYLPENIISNFTNIRAIICDSFCGTGTTMVAAHQLKRKCYGMELDCKYCQVIIDRMKKLDPTLRIKRNGVDVTNEWN